MVKEFDISPEIEDIFFRWFDEVEKRDNPKHIEDIIWTVWREHCSSIGMVTQEAGEWLKREPYIAKYLI